MKKKIQMIAALALLIMAAAHSKAARAQTVLNRLNANPDYILDFDARYLPECYYMESEEKAVVYYLNYARINPRQFCEKYVKPHAPWYKGYAFDERKESLIETLNTMTPILGGEIKPDENLYELAQCFAAKSGELGITGHDRSATQCTYLTGTWGECCDYGHAGGLEIVLSLLIDAGENNAALGHRKICLDPAYTKIGVSMQPHRNYGNIAVLDFGN